MLHLLKDLVDLSKSMFLIERIICFLKVLYLNKQVPPLPPLNFVVQSSRNSCLQLTWNLIFYKLEHIYCPQFSFSIPVSSVFLFLLDCVLLDTLLPPNCRAVSFPHLHRLGSIYNLCSLPAKHFAEKAEDFLCFLLLPSL